MKPSNTLDSEDRQFLPSEFKLTVWSKLRPYFQDLLLRKINSAEDSEKWLKDRNELETYLQEEFNRRYINVNLGTKNNSDKELYEYGIQKLSPKIDQYKSQLNEKLSNCHFSS